MLSNLSYLLVTVTWLASVCTAIRVEWNTNTGPIIPPTPRTTVKPVPPFRNPAPVWEAIPNDIPNPNPYIYVPPPPSRPKQRLNTKVNYNVNANSGRTNYGIIVTPQNANNFYNNNNNNSPQVSSLSPQYVPNVGTRYVAVVPSSIATKSSASPVNEKYPQTPAANSLSPDDKNAYKLHGKYNAKTKKYKAYEKVKYVPLNYYPSFKPSDNTTVAQTELLSDPQIRQLQLPDKQITRKWSSLFDSFNTTLAPKETQPPAKSYTKHVYAKDKPVTKSKEKLSDFVDKTKKS